MHEIADCGTKASSPAYSRACLRSPANTAIVFKIDKDKMKFKVNGKTYEFLVVGTSALQTQ